MESHSYGISLLYGLLRRLLKPLIKALWIKKVTGLSNIPKKGSAIIAMNHQSFFDFLTLSVVSSRNIHFLAAEKFFYHPVWKHIMRASGQIKVDRKSDNKEEVHDKVKKHIEKSTLIGIFPEGTRSESKTHMLKAYTGIARYALAHKIPIIPVGIIGADEVLPKGAKKIKTGKMIEIHIGEPIHLEHYWGEEEDKETRTIVTEKVIKKIESLSKKIYPHYEFKHD